MKRRRLIADPVVDFRETLDTDERQTTYGVGCDGTVIAAAARTDESRRCPDPSFAKSRFDRPTSYEVVAYADGEMRHASVDDVRLVAHHVQPVSGGFMLVSGRCRWHDYGPEKNAAIYDWSGHRLARLTLGDGITDVRVTPNGTIWVSYFDEGVYGNYGWGGPGPTPMGRSGLVAFDSSGEVQYEWPGRADGRYVIDDVYAMNVADDDDVWFYFYQDFPIVRLHDGESQVWRWGRSDSSALAVADERALLYGRRGHATSVRLDPHGHTKVLGEFKVVAPDGHSLAGCSAFGTGDRLYLFDDLQAYVCRVRG